MGVMNENGYVEVEKVPISDQEKERNKEKVKFWVTNIGILTMGLVGATIFTMSGGNFFSSFLGFTAVPSVPLLAYDIHYLLERKRNKEKDNESDIDAREMNGRGR